MIIHTTFDEVSLTGYKTVRCTGCGRRLKRQRKFWQTRNPYNKNSEGYPKSAYEIREELSQDIRVWEKESETCSKCEQIGVEDE